ncbi:alpha-tocopherol transfer protein-like isoform X2 [Plodia interpunctella]|uniref:alpha-tocopherol transfer protein-like isoform X2 n=1 Tax=Plodia interpunctella TaxID=58824 RepID=UPI0023685BC7|nr:alpha-tocopherol transfer protein-like isoform X2 [Plodia interpunctella]
MQGLYQSIYADTGEGKNLQRANMTEVKSPEETDKLVQQMRDWYDSQPHLPKDIDDKFLLRFLHSCYYDVEAATVAMDLFFSIRLSAIDLFSNRDPLSLAMQKTFKITNLAQLRISGNRKLWIWQLNDPGLDNYDYAQDAKLFLLSTDAWLLENDDFLEESDIVLMDVKDISLKFLTKFNMSIAKKMTRYQQEGMPIRLKEIHIVNAPSYIDKIFNLLKPVLKPEITQMVHFHTPKSETLYQYLSRAELPAELGGARGALRGHAAHVADMVARHRDRLNGKLWIPEKKSKSKSKLDPVSSDVAPSFRALAID